jgi:hypothetical protein
MRGGTIPRYRLHIIVIAKNKYKIMQKNIGSKLVENLCIKRCSDTDKVVPHRKNDTFYIPQNVLSGVPVFDQ